MHVGVQVRPGLHSRCVGAVTLGHRSRRAPTKLACMKRTIVRFQLVLLVVAVGLILYRVLDGPSAPSGTLVLYDLSEGDLEMRTLRVTGQPQPFAIEAIGSFASPDGQHLEAYAWLVNRDTREVVWQMTPQRAQRTRGTVAEQRDTVTIGPGVYDAYFTSLGSGERDRSSGLFGTSNRWRNNEPHWRFVMQALGDPAFARSERTERDQAGPKPAGLLWSTAPDEGHDRATTTFVVRRPARVNVYAVGAFEPTASPALTIQPVGGSAPVWSLPMAETQYAGGGRGNRAFRGAVTLQPGLYEVVHEPSDDGWNRWDVNPPFDPAAWGVTLSTPDSGAVVRFTPFETIQPTVAIRQPGDDVDRYVSFRVAERTPVFVFGMGEMNNENSRYDYGWIESEDGAHVWEMEYDDARHAGGAHKNRLVEAWITLAPGSYRLRYRSDGSHSYGSFNDQEPDHPERWGIALFTERPTALVKGAEGQGETGAIPLAAEMEVLAREMEAHAEEIARATEMGRALGTPPPPSSEGVVVALLRTGNRQSLNETFEVAEPRAYRLYATGELHQGERYDYALLRDAEGRVVWEMTDENTQHAGGGERNRVFDGVVLLHAGRYTLHYQTDGSYAFGDFPEGDAPTFPHAWGVILKPASD